MNRRFILSIIIFIFTLTLIGCVSSPKYSSQPARKEMRWKRGNEYVLESITGMASFYGQKFHGRKTSNGETFDMWAMTAAHKEYPFGTMIRVTNLKNDKSVIVRINDRGPFIEGRIIDLSRGAAGRIGLIEEGVAKVRLDVLEWGEQ